jgi:hypothetical protein
MSRIGSCEEALLLGVGDGGEVPVRAGAPTAAEEAGAERAVPSLWVEPGDAVTLSEEATDTGMKNPAEIPPNSNKNWSSSPSNFPPKNDFLRFFSKITSKKTRSKRVLLLY